MSQLAFLPGIDPDRLIVEAKAEHRPVATVCLFSGGNDSTVLAHRCREHYESLAFIDTGTALPGVRGFVENFALWLDKPLAVYEAGDRYRRLVLGFDKADKGYRAFGFPDGHNGHNRAYNALKKEQLYALRRERQAGQRGARVLMLTGLRRSESQRRRTRRAINRDGGMVFVNPLIDWDDATMRAYREEHELPRSDVVALTHRSGECNCGAFAAPGEREMLASLWPEWFEDTIASLEREAEARGIRACRWGQRTESYEGDAGPLCSDCQLRFEAAYE